MRNLKILIILFLYIIPQTVKAQLSFETSQITGREDIIFNPKLFDYENLDLDQDGDFDILVYTDFTILWYENRDGAGNFSSAKMIYDNSSSIIRNIEIGDLDGDSDIDITFRRSGNDIGWIANQGNGNFGDFNIIQANFASFFNWDISDIDGDNDNDILLHFPDGVIWYENTDGLGTFAEATVVLPPFDSFSSSIFTLEDVNNDSKIDIILYDASIDQISWYENLGNMMFSSAKKIHANLNLSHYDLKKVDIDGDEYSDFIGGRSNFLIWYEFDGTGSFSQTIINLEQGTNASSFISNDFDSDGDIDLVYTDGEYLFWLENNDGLGNFSSPNRIDYFPCFQCSNNRNKLASGDYDGNGTIDIITSIFSVRIGRVYVYSNIDNQGNFDSRKIISDQPFVNEIKPVDIDKDGDLDLLVQKNYYSAIYRNINGTFDKQESYSGPDLLKDSELIDIDNDGDLDILSIRDVPSPNFVWYENIDGLGNFKNSKIIESSIEINTQSTIGDLVVGDIDKDGFQDFALVQYKNNETVRWLKNENGTGSFSNMNEIATNVDRPRAIKLGDLDGDSDLDIIFIQDDGQIKWFQNTDGKGSFSTEILIPGGLAFRGFVVEDFDKDNDLDIITYGNRIMWHENIDGNANFTNPILIGNPLNNIEYVNVLDLDGDNDKDIIWKSWGKKGIFWYENLNENFEFSDEISIFTSDRTSVEPVTATGDFNGDSKIDIAYSEQYEYKVGTSTYTPDRLLILTNTTQTGTLSIQDQTLSDCNLYPIPLTNSLKINCLNDYITQLELYNFQGKLLTKKSFTEKNNELDVNDLPHGVYFIKMLNEFGQIILRKVIK